MPDVDTRTALAAQGAVVVGLVEGITDWSAHTRLPGWSVRVLVGHLTSGLEAIWRWIGEPVDGSLEFDSVSYWDPVAMVAEPSSDWALAYAAKRTDEQLRAELPEALAEAARAVATTGPEAWIVPPLGSARVPFDEFLATRVLELTVHGLDLSAALGSDTAPATDATALVASILDARLDGDRPGDLGDDVAWVEAATGRVPHPDGRLPVLA